MSKMIFRISGNMMQDGEWMQPDPAFVGEIVVDEDGKFFGWCDSLYINNREQHSEPNWQHFLTGAVAEENGGYSLLFFRLSNVIWQPPMVCEIHDTSPADCVWAAKDPGGSFVPQGNARAKLEKLAYSDEYAERIKQRFQEVDTTIDHNAELIQEVDSWQQKKLVLWV